MKIAILVPCYSGNVNFHHMLSMVATIKAMKRAEAIILSNLGSSLLHMARNVLVAQAMAQGADKLVFIDDDISWTPNGFEKLVLAPAKICGGVYQKKMHSMNGQPQMAVSMLPEDQRTNQNGLLEVDGAATGFLRIDREVIEGMKPYCMKVEDQMLTPEEAKHMHKFFDFGHLIKDNKTYVHGEDYYFCGKAREAGFRTYVDPSIKLGHHSGGMRWDAQMQTVDLL